MADLLSQSADAPSFRVVPPSNKLSVDDILGKTSLPDGTPMFQPGGFLVPPARSFSTIVNAASRVYSYRWDEAMRDNFVNARAMRRDAFLLGLLEERILPTINRTFQLKIKDERDPEQKAVRDGIMDVIKRIPDFDAYKRAQMDAVWFGRAGCQWGWRRDEELNYRWGIPKWDPIHGDSVQYTFDGIPAILIDGQTAAWYSANGATWGPNGDLRPTDRGGTALVLHRPYWRDRFAIHVHMRQKADFFEGELAGSVQGLGLRGQVYWQYVVRTDALTWMLAYMQAVGQMDLLVFNYPAGNAEAKANQEANAQKIIGKAAIACPRNPTGNWPAIEQIQMNSAGLKALHDLVADYFDRHIERLIVGQSMSSGADKGDGLGGTGRAQFAKQTKDEILVYDTQRLDYTMSQDLILPIKKYNYGKAKFPVTYESILPNLEAEGKVESGGKLVSMGIAIKTDEIREAAGYSRPEPGDETVGGPPSMEEMMMQAMQQGGGAPGGAPPAGPGGPPMPPTNLGPAAVFSGGQTGMAHQLPPGAPVPNSRYARNPVRYAEMHDHPEHKLLVRAIDANPLDATAHLAHADWLEENGFPDEAAFRRGMGNWIQHEPVIKRSDANNQYPWAPASFPKEIENEPEVLELRRSHGSSAGWANWNMLQGWIRTAFRKKAERSKRNDVSDAPTQFAEGGGGTPPSAGPVMGGQYYPGGGNTYIPKMGRLGKSLKNDTIKTTRYARDAKERLCSTQVNLTGIAAIRALDLGFMIPEADLSGDGREQCAHVTVRYGLHEGTLDDAADIIKNFGRITLRLGGISHFSGEEHDVVIIEVDSPDLVRLNKELGKLPNTQTHPTYKPHCTLAYVKKGQGKRIAEQLPPCDTDFTADAVVYSDCDKNPTWISVVNPMNTTDPILPYQRGMVQYGFGDGMKEFHIDPEIHMVTRREFKAGQPIKQILRPMRIFDSFNDKPGWGEWTWAVDREHQDHQQDVADDEYDLFPETGEFANKPLGNQDYLTHLHEGTTPEQDWRPDQMTPEDHMLYHRPAPQQYARKVGRNWREQDVTRNAGKFTTPARKSRMEWNTAAQDVGGKPLAPTEYAEPHEYPEHQQLLAAIHADPLEATTHLAHADWLEENGFDPGFRKAMAKFVAKPWQSQRALSIYSPHRSESMPWRLYPVGTRLPEGINPDLIPRLPGYGSLRSDTPRHVGVPLGDGNNLHWRTYSDMEEGLRRAHEATQKQSPIPPWSPGMRPTTERHAARAQENRNASIHIPDDEDPTPASRYAADRAPVDGIVLGSKTYRSGQFLPSRALVRSTQAERNAVESGDSRWHPLPPPVDEVPQDVDGQQIGFDAPVTSYGRRTTRYAGGNPAVGAPQDDDGRQIPSPTPDETTVPHLGHPQRKFLGESEPEKVHPNHDENGTPLGQSESHVFHFPGGTKGLFKPASGEMHARTGVGAGNQYHREVATSVVADILGLGHMVPKTTYRDHNGEVGSIQHWVDGTTKPRRVSFMDRYGSPEHTAHAGVLDYLTGQSDRHEGNWLVGDNGKIHLIDNGNAFPRSYHDETYNGELLSAANRLPLPEMVKNMGGHWPAIKKALRGLGIDEPAIALTEQRFKHLINPKHTHFYKLPKVYPGA